MSVQSSVITNLQLAEANIAAIQSNKLIALHRDLQLVYRDKKGHCCAIGVVWCPDEEHQDTALYHLDTVPEFENDKLAIALQEAHDSWFTYGVCSDYLETLAKLYGKRLPTDVITKCEESHEESFI